MKKFVLVLTVLFINYIAINNGHAQENGKVVTGKISKNELKKSLPDNWYKERYENYELNNEVIEQLKDKVPNVTVTIFVGSWCEDTLIEAPAFFKVLEACNFKDRGITIIAMDKNKSTAENLEKGLNIDRVPTFIFYEKGVEINRIVERPMVSLEQDMLDILSGKNYKPQYAE